MARRKLNYAKIAAAVKEGRQSRKQMAVRFGLLAKDSPDPMKPLRAVLSRMRTKGYEDEHGRIVKL